MTVHSEMKRESIGALIADMGFALWRLRHRGASFGEFYARRIGTPPVEPAEFRSRGADCFKWFRERNLRPDMSCIDYGCGSLRVGQHAMRALDPGDYWGLDVSDDFITSGLDLVDPQVIEDKRPRLSVISDSTVAEVRNWQPHAIFSNAVLQHVPEPELLSFFRRIAAMMGPGTIAAINFVDRPKVSRVKAMSWAYPDELLIAKAIEADPGLIAECSVISAAHAKAFPDRRRLLVLRRPAD